MNLKAKKFWVDGGCRGNGRPYAEAYGSINDGELTRTVEWLGLRTNNEAEYATLISLLMNLPSNSRPTIFMDSKLVVQQLQGNWKVRANNLKPWFELCERHLKRTKATLRWVPRDVIVQKVGH